MGMLGDVLGKSLSVAHCWCALADNSTDCTTEGWGRQANFAVNKPQPLITTQLGQLWRVLVALLSCRWPRKLDVLYLMGIPNAIWNARPVAVCYFCSQCSGVVEDLLIERQGFSPVLSSSVHIYESASYLWNKKVFVFLCCRIPHAVKHSKIVLQSNGKQLSAICGPLTY